MTSPISYPEPVSASSPTAGAGYLENSGADLNGVSVRPMRLKVLYTFDDDNKTNCLARWPHVLNVQTVHLDESTAIGVIELKTCIQAIVSASPELVAKLGQDYTVYAYDYSEYDTPLVGQGMLSWALASASPTPGAPAHQSRTMITGRVCKNLLGLFSNGVKETLEVKLRLVSVPTCLQSEYLRSMDKYREISNVMPTGFDPNAWQAFLQANPQIAESTSRVGTPNSIAGARPNEGAGMELLGQLLERGLLPEHVVETLYRSKDQGLLQANEASPQPRRGATPASNAPSPPAMDQRSTSLMMSQQQPSRPASQASMKAAPTSALTMTNALANQQKARDGEDQGNNADHEDGPTRKRARVTKAKWNGKSCLEGNAESLRVAASTAAGMRMYRPIAINPALANQTSQEAPARAPTPRPDQTSTFHRRAPSMGGSALGRETFHQNNSMPASPTPSARSLYQSIESTGNSPEDYRDGSIMGTPIDIASSPPMVGDAASTPSSPVLPTLPRHVDSGFMSGTLDEGFESRHDKRRDNCPRNQSLNAAPSVQTAALSFEEVTPGPPELLPTRILPRPPAGQKYGIVRSQSMASSEADGQLSDAGQGSTAQKGKKARKPRAPPKSRAKPPPGLPPIPVDIEPAPPRQIPPRTLTRTPSIGKMTLPPVAASDPAHVPSNLRRTQTWSGAEHAMSDAPFSQPISAAPIRKPEPPPKLVRNGSGVKRRQAIQKRLATAIQSGETPPYCENCGAIETPTWRKSWFKAAKGSPEGLEVSDEEGGIFAIIETEKDKDDKVIAYSILKKTITDEEEGFTEIQLCNPCGLWLYKFKNMRPQEKWNPQPKDPNEKKSRPPRKRNAGAKTDASMSEADTPREVSEPATETTQPAESTTNESRTVTAIKVDQSEPPPLMRKPRASSVQLDASAERNGNGGWNEASAAAALTRAIQSSPARRLGTMHSPINVDDLGSTRRVLFPSPKKANETPTKPPKATPGTEKRMMLGGLDEPDLQSTKPTADQEGPEQSPDQSDKENRPPPRENEDDDIWKLFEDDGSTTPTHVVEPEASLKTPVRATPNRHHMSTRKTPNQGGFSSTGKDCLLPPRTPSTRDRSPTKSVLGEAVEPSPFTIHLQNILSEAYISPSHQHVDLRSMPPLEDLWPTTSLAGGPMVSSSGTADVAGGDHRRRRSTSLRLSNLDFDPDDVFSTDVPMPSSPPAGAFFSLYEDPCEAGSGLWSDFDLPGANHQALEEIGLAVTTGTMDHTGGAGEGMAVDFSALMGEAVPQQQQSS